MREKERTPKEMADWLILNRENPTERCNSHIESHKSVIKVCKEYDKNIVRQNKSHFENMIRHNENQVKWWEEVKKIIENEKP